MNDQLYVLQLVAERLEKAVIPYMVSGSVAINYYAQPRLTRDIDIIVELAPADAERIIELFEPDFYIDEEMVRTAIARQSLFNVIHNDLIVKIDFIVKKDTPYRKNEFSRRLLMKIDNFQLWLVAAEDLILSKLVWAKDSHSEMQLNDIRNLLASVPDLDVNYIEHWATELDVMNLWSQL
ncbi:MAG: hypothetical protein U1F76_06185 [Candidatus Competibacteraceae bacterium]